MPYLLPRSVGRGVALDRQRGVVAAPPQDSPVVFPFTVRELRPADPVAVAPRASGPVRGWHVLVLRVDGGDPVWGRTLVTGAVPVSCNEWPARALVTADPLPREFTGAAAFDLDGRLAGLVADCGRRELLLPMGEVERLAALAVSPAGRALVIWGLGLGPSPVGASAGALADSGAPVARVRILSPAGLAGIYPGDRIVAVNGTAVADGAALTLLADSAADSVALALASGATARGAPGRGGPARGDPVVLRRTAGRDWRAGVLPRGVELSGVLPGSPAATAGLAAGDRVVRFAGRPVTSERGLAAMLATPRRAPALVVYGRDGWLRATELPPE